MAITTSSSSSYIGAPGKMSTDSEGPTSVTINMDNEDYIDDSKDSGWTGASYSNTTRTRLRVCAVDGDDFKPLTTGGTDNDYHYAVLLLGTVCPEGSTRFYKEIDNENSDNDNSISGDAGPNKQVGTNTWLYFCLFRGADDADDTMSSFPEIESGFQYGVFARSDFSKARSTGYLFSDDENTTNDNTFWAEEYRSDAARIISSGTNTKMHTVRVR